MARQSSSESGDYTIAVFFLQHKIPNAFQMLQESLQHYQSGQFVAAVTLWQQAADAFAVQGDNQERDSFGSP